MKRKNKETGEIANFEIYKIAGLSDDGTPKYELFRGNIEEWEYYEEPKVYYYISDFGAIRECEIGKFPEDEEDRKRIGNYFETKEEAEEAVRKLKAWKQLKDKGFRFNNCKIEMSEIVIPEITITAFVDTEEPETLNLVNVLFGGEE